MAKYEPTSRQQLNCSEKCILVQSQKSKRVHTSFLKNDLRQKVLFYFVKVTLFLKALWKNLQNLVFKIGSRMYRESENELLEIISF